ncbi:uncharacterized protein LOC144075629 isoform X2 [Stigmatopora argus]
MEQVSTLRVSSCSPEFYYYLSFFFIGYGDHFFNESEEEEILVPPPPSTAPPPPPPETFVLPPPDFMGYLSTSEMMALQPPSQAAPKPQPKQEKNRRVIKPPPIAPPKPPSTGSSDCPPSTPLSKPSPAKVPKHPNYAPPLPPNKGQQKTLKAPPPKPIRQSSMANADSPPTIPAPSPPVKSPTQSTFNPQNTAKVNHVSNTSVLKGYGEQDPRPKQVLLFDDIGSPNPVSMSVPMNGNVLRETPNKPVRKDPLHHKENLQSTRNAQTPVHESHISILKDDLYHKENVQNIEPSWSHMPEVTPKTNTEKILGQNETVKPQRLSYQIPRKLQTGNRGLLTAEDIQGKLSKPPGKFSSLFNHTPHNGESSGAPVASPLSLLLAAQERDKYKDGQSRENGTMNNERRGSTQNYNSIPKTLTTTQRARSISSLWAHDNVQVSPTSVKPVQYLEPKSSTMSQLSTSTYSRPAESLTTPASSVDMSSRLAVRKDSNVKTVAGIRYSGLPILPPPPEFDDFDGVTRSSSYINPPDPPLIRMAPTHKPDPLRPAHIPPSPLSKASKEPTPYISVQPQSKFQTNHKADPTLQPPSHVPPSPLSKTSKHPSPNVVQPNSQYQINSKTDITQRPASALPNKTTIVSILQKKMLEMDQKITTPTEADYDADDWGVSLSEDKVPVIPKATAQVKSVSTGKNQTPTHYKQGGKVAKKHPDINDNEPLSSYQYGMTYRVRPGSKQPITLIRKGL